MKVFFLITFNLFLFLSCKSKFENVTSISIEELEIELAKDIQLVDVRTPKEWEKGIINGALKINVTSDDFETKSEKILDKTKPVYLYCRTEGRSFKVAEILFEKGYKAIYVIGGYNEWKDKIEE